MAEKNSLWKNIRNKAKQNRASGATPKKPTKAMLDQEKKIKAKYAEGGEMPLGLPLKEQNPYLVPEYNQPMANGYILPDPNRPRLLPDVNASEYKSTQGTDTGDVQIPTIVGGQYIGNNGAWERYKNTGEQFKPMADPSSYSKFYDTIEPLGLMKEKKAYGGYMKKFKKKYLLGGATAAGIGNATGTGDALSDAGTDAGSGGIGAGGIMQLGQMSDQGMGMMREFGNDYLRGRGADDNQIEIVNRFSNKVQGIPAIGKQLGLLGDTWNAITGKTQDRLGKYNTEKKKVEFDNNQEANYLSGYSQDARATFATGGDLSMLEGPSHDEGGIQLTQDAEVEGGETKNKDYIFSDRLNIPGKKITFAQKSKQINKMYLGKRPNDPISKAAEERELATLQDMQEIVRGDIMSNAYTKAYGGFMKKKKYAGGGGFGTENLYNQPFYPTPYGQSVDSMNEVNPLLLQPSAIPQENYISDPIDNNNYSLPKKPLPNKGFDSVTDNLKLNTAGSDVSLPDTEEVGDSAFGIQPEDYASMGVQALSGLSQLYYGLKGPDKVRDAKLKLARASKLNMTPSKRLAATEIDTAFNAADESIKGATGTGNYMSNRLASAIKRARTKGETIAKISENEANANAQIQNQNNQYNSQVLNQEEQLNLAQEDKRIQEKDAARMAVTEGLNNVGQSVGQGVRDVKSYDMQKLKAKWLGTKDIVEINGEKYYKLSNGTYKKAE